MPETENLGIIERLNAGLLEGGRYQTLVQLDTTSVTEDRGIDVAILSRLGLAAPAAAHRIDFGDDAELCGGTRDIVEAPLSLPDGKVLHVFGVHFPSGGNPLICRQHAMAELNRIRAPLPEEALAVAGGDFNFNCSEAQGALFEHMVRHGDWGVPPPRCAPAATSRGPINTPIAVSGPGSPGPISISSSSRRTCCPSVRRHRAGSPIWGRFGHSSDQPSKSKPTARDMYLLDASILQPEMAYPIIGL